MKLNLDMMRVWAALTGFLLVAWMLLQIWLGHRMTHVIPQLIATIMGFELALLGRDLWRKREQRRG